jgi:histidinol-phosphate phosphatase family protein
VPAPLLPDRVAAVLVDRDGTLVVDVPYNGDPDRVVALPGVAAALGRLRAAGVPLGIVSNQRGVALGRFTAEDLDAVNRRVVALLGPFDVICCCEHDVVERCPCRKPRPGLVVRAARRLGVRIDECVVIGDSWSDVAAARRAGAHAVLLAAVPSAAVLTCRDLPAAVDLLLGARVPA